MQKPQLPKTYSPEQRKEKLQMIQSSIDKSEKMIDHLKSSVEELEKHSYQQHFSLSTLDLLLLLICSVTLILKIYNITKPE